MRKNLRVCIIRMACFLSAFFAAGAGFAFCAYNSERKYEKRLEAYEKLNVAEATEAVERLSEALRGVLEEGQGTDTAYLSDVRLHALEAERAFGLIFEKKKAGEEIFAFLKAVSLVSENALSLGIAADDSFESGAPTPAELRLLLAYNDKLIAALPLLLSSASGFYEATEEIFSDTLLGTLIYEKGYGVPIPDYGFEGGVGEMMSEREAKALARKYIGKNAALDSMLCHDSGIYYLCGKNVSAIVNGRSGSIMQFLFDTAKGEALVGAGEAMDLARGLLSELGFDSGVMLAEYIKNEGSLHIFEFIPFYDGVICHSEAVTVGVSESTGRVRLFDAVDYFRYHRKKLDMPAFIRSAEDIAERYVGAENIRLCKIERTEGVESFCYRFDILGREMTVSALTGLKIDK